MTLEEKAKAYDEALERAKEYMAKGYDVLMPDLFPELKESENEKIIEAIEGTIRIYGKTQGEWIGGYDMDTLVVHLRKAFGALEKQKEQKPAEWSEEDTEMYINVASSLRGYACGLENEEHKKHIKKELDWLENRFKSLRPQPQGTYKQIVHSIYEMLKDKDFTEITPDHRVSLLNDIRVKCGHADEWAGILDEPSWKPSEEQMKWLKDVIETVPMTCRQQVPLESLYVDLQKLL